MPDRTLIEAFYRAFYGGISAREPERFASFLAADVSWSMYGPVDVLPYCGRSLGKEAALAIYRKVAEVFADVKYALDSLIVEGDSAAAFIRYSARQRATGRAISYNVAHFMRFRGDEIIEFRVLVDTFDVVEQMLGREIDLARESPVPERIPA